MSKNLKEIRLDLVDKDGNVNTYTQTTIPMKKLIEWYQVEEAIEKGELKKGLEVIERKIRFVADLFDDKRVTPEAILEGLDARNFQDTIQNIIWQVLGVNPDTLDGEEKK